MFNRCPTIGRFAIAEQPLPVFGIRHGSAARTGWDASPCRWTPFDGGSALPAVANRQFVCSRVHRRRSRRASRRSACAPRGGILCCRTRARTSMSGRSRQDASDGEKRVSDTVRAAKYRACSKNSLCGRGNKNAPGWVSEGVRVPRRSGWPISVEKSAVGDVETVLRLQDAVAGHARKRIAQLARGVVSAMVAAGGFHRKGSQKRGSAEVAAQEAAMPSCDGRARYTRRFRFANIFFTSVDRADGRQAIVRCKKSGMSGRAKKNYGEAATKNRAAEAALYTTPGDAS